MGDSGPAYSPPACEGLDGLAQAVQLARRTPALLAELEGLYRELDERLAGRPGQCRGCGQCCDFAAYGHRLYVSSAELALLTRAELADPRALGEHRCPYRREGLCTARRERALGCRVFFCQGIATATVNGLYEDFHGRIRQVHRRYCIPYTYAELTASLAQLITAAKVS